MLSVDEAWLRCRWRVGGKPGDLALRNRLVTAIISRDTGWLVDFWPNASTQASAPQLREATEVDGLTVWNPTLNLGHGALPIVARSVVLEQDQVRAELELGMGPGSGRITTTYALDGERPRLLVTTTVQHLGGGRIEGVSLGDRLKWGNTHAFVESLGRAPRTFGGYAYWVGRRGAGGDLVLSTAHRHRMRIDYTEGALGQAGPIFAEYSQGVVLPGSDLVARRTLAYEPILQATLPPAPTGLLDVTLTDERGQPLAAKLSLRGVGGTPTPDFGNDGDLTGANRFVWSGTGRFSRTLLPGRYEVLATAGIERDAQSWQVEITAGQTTTRRGQLPRVIATPGWIAADLHLHHAPSPDADIDCATRAVSVAAEGVEFAVATDHNAVGDLEPAILALRRAGRLASPLRMVPGTEVSTAGNPFGHFNAFPLRATDVIPYEDTTPAELFARVRQVAPQAILQVNHPRLSGLGYWDRYGLDPHSRRVPLGVRGEFVTSYDAIEVANGFELSTVPRVRQILLDWMHLLGQGYRYVATGNSDSHRLFFVDPGVPRNLIRYGARGDDAAYDDELDTKAGTGEILAALRLGQVVVTSGPVIDVEVQGVGPGGTVSHVGKTIDVHLVIRAAPWIDVSEAEILLGPQGRRVRFVPIPPSPEIVRLDATYRLEVPRGSFFLVWAYGRKPLPNVYSSQIRPLAFTNPIWVDA